MKRVYAAAGLMVAAGAVTGYLLSPRPTTHEAAPAAAEQPEPARGDSHRSRGGGGGGGGVTLSGGGGRVSLPAFAGGGGGGGGGGRPDCFYLRMSFNKATKENAKSPAARKARAQAQQAGCWVPEQKS